MAHLTWDDDGKRLYETGVSKVALYVYNTEENKYIGIDKKGGVAWNGVSSIQETPSGADNNDIYADNIKYLSLRAAEDFGCTIEAYTYPDEWGVCDGSVSVMDGTSEMGLTIGQQTRHTFGLAFESIVGNDTENNDYGTKIHLIYKATASPSSRSYQTVNNSPEAISFSWEVSCLPIDITGYKPSAILTIDCNKLAAYNPDGLATLKKKLWGDESDESAIPELPLPAEVISILKKAAG